MAAPAQVELPADCPSCGLESGLVERYDASAPTCRLGVPASARCKLCGVAFEGGLDRPVAHAWDGAEDACPVCRATLDAEGIAEHRCRTCGARATTKRTSQGATFETENDVERALDAWAAQEGFASRQALLDATFAVPSVTHLWGRLARGERLEILADPFARWGMRMTETADPTRAENMQDAWDSADDLGDLDDLPPTSGVPISGVPSSRSPSSRAPSSLRTSRPPGVPDPLAPLYPILGVIAADGEIHPEERRFLDELVRREGLPPVADDAIQVYALQVYPVPRAARLVPRARREATLKTMCEVAAADGMVDESERRVIHAYAAIWGVPDETVDFWIWGYENMNTSLVRQLWTRLRRFVLPLRWAETKKPLLPSNTSLAPSVQEHR